MTDSTNNWPSTPNGIIILVIKTHILGYKLLSIIGNGSISTVPNSLLEYSFSLQLGLEGESSNRKIQG